MNKTIIQEETLFENTGEIKQKVIDFFLFPVYNINKHMNNCSYEAAKRTAGVKDATVNFMMLKMNVEFEDGQDPKAVMKEVLKNCKKVEDDCEIYL